MSVPKHILPSIVFAQFLCTSLWFASNGVMGDLVDNFNLQESALGFLTSSVQLGFIIGTLCFAILTIADRYSPSKVFFVSALLGAFFNLGLLWSGNSLYNIILFRFLTGFFLAGIYPVGMKIAADYFDTTLGKSLGYLVSALVLGTSFPHFLKVLTADFPWKSVIISVSSLASFGGLLMLFLVPDGPYRKAGQKLNLSAFFKIFKHPNFRGAAFGYFGHMWELYAFWTFVPIMLSTYVQAHSSSTIDVSFWCFFIIGIGGIACALGGYLSQRFGPKRIAYFALLLSGLCCLTIPFFLESDSTIIFLSFMLFWGMVVIADSPMFSTMVAHFAPATIKGTALTTVNCIGFAITIISIQLLTYLVSHTNSNMVYSVLVLGPIFGLAALRKIKPN